VKKSLERTMGQLTEQNSHVVHLGNDDVQHFVGDVFNLIGARLKFHPSQQFFFLLEISFVNGRDSLLEVQKLWQLVDSVLLGLLSVVDFHKRNSELIALVIDVLQLCQDFVRLLIVVVIC
jgi:hypothetical protein